MCAFEAASKRLDQKAASHVLQAGKEVDTVLQINQVDPKENMRLIIYAAKQNLPHLFAACLRKGASIEKIDGVDELHLVHVAAEYSSQKILATILKKNPSLADQEDDEGKTPLVYAENNQINKKYLGKVKLGLIRLRQEQDSNETDFDAAKSMQTCS